MSDEDYKQALYRGELRIDCSRITLTQNSSNGPLVFSGNGYIYQLADGDIRFHMFAQPEGGVRARALFDMSLSANLLTKEYHFTFEAVAYGGGTWTCDAVRAEPAIYEPDLIIRGGLYEIRKTDEGSEGESPFFLQVQIFQKLDLQHTAFVETVHDFGNNHQRRLSRYSSNIGPCETRSLEGRVLWHVSSQTELPGNLHNLVIAAFEFLTAKTVVPRVIDHHRRSTKTLRLLSPRPISHRTRLRRPISAHHLVDYEMPWRLFSLYLEYLCSYSGSGWHPCVLHVHNAIEASANSLDAARLGLCVAVEGLAKLIPVPTDDEQKKAIKKLIKVMKCVILRSGLNDTALGQRAEGLLIQLHTPRLKDRLEPLVKTGEIRPSLIKAWSELRHGAAHAAAFDIDNARPDETAKLLSGIDKVTTLMYEIIFHLIGYEEEYTDYSEWDQPPRRLKTGTTFSNGDPRAKRYPSRPSVVP
jgi:hypothetical protein